MINDEHRYSTELFETQLTQKDACHFIHDHLLNLRSIAHTVEWTEMIYYIEMALFVSREKNNSEK